VSHSAMIPQVSDCEPMIRREVVVTGLGAVSALGRGCDALWAAVERGCDGIRTVGRFSTEGFGVHLAAMVPGLDGAGEAEELCEAMAVEAAREAWERARAGDSGVPPERVGLVVGTSIGDRELRYGALAKGVARALSIEGPVITVSTACSSSTNAIGLALDLLQDSADLVVAGGADLLTPEVFAGFHALGVLSAEKCAPFSSPPGTTLGEGAGFVVLETKDSAGRRGAEPFASILGYGLSGDAFHETTPDPTGRGIARSMAAALEDAGLAPRDIGYINAHGTGTESNDPSEWKGILRIFGDRSALIPVSSSKSFFGHAQGAAGVLEIIATIMAMRRGVVPQTLHYKGPRPLSPVDPVASEKPRPQACDHALCLNSAFGGANAALVVSHPSGRGRAAARRSLCILGAGVVGPHGTDLPAFSCALEKGLATGSRTPKIEIDRLLPTADPRGLDPVTVNLTAAAVLALGDAGLTVRGALKDRAGLVAGLSRVSPESLKAFRDSIAARGLPRVSASAFSRIVLNAPAGSCMKLLSLRGPTSTISTGPGSGLAAIVYAAMILSARSGVEIIVAGGADELAENERREGLFDGGACVVLGPDRAGSRPSAMLAGWGLAGRGSPDKAAERALVMAGMGLGDIQAVFGSDGLRGAGGIPHVDPSALLGKAGAAAAACVAAFLSVRSGRTDTALAVSAESSSLSAALVVRRRPATACPGGCDAS
jgi:3-oxoacyl-[acyl-carrier-protein] synthase II